MHLAIQEYQKAFVMRSVRRGKVHHSVAVLAEISLRSPRKLFIFIIKENIHRIKVFNKINYLILKKTSLVHQTGSDDVGRSVKLLYNALGVS